MTEEIPRSITVSGAGACTVVPDMARLSVGVSLQSSNLGQARGRVGTKMQAARRVLIRNGIPESDLTTTRLNVHSFREPSGPPQHQVSTMLNAVIRELEGLDALVNQVLDAIEGGAELQGVNFDAADRTSSQRAAREAAFIDARDKAHHLAQLAGSRLGEVLRIGEEQHNHGQTPRMARMVMAESVADSSIPIDSGDLVENASISATWALLPG